MNKKYNHLFHLEKESNDLLLIGLEGKKNLEEAKAKRYPDDRLRAAQHHRFVLIGKMEKLLAEAKEQYTLATSCRGQCGICDNSCNEPINFQA